MKYINNFYLKNYFLMNSNKLFQEIFLLFLERSLKMWILEDLFFPYSQFNKEDVAFLMSDFMC